MVPSFSFTSASYTALPSIFMPSRSTGVFSVPPLARIVLRTASGTLSHFCGFPAKHTPVMAVLIANAAIKTAVL